jgi:hypothetical protein
MFCTTVLVLSLLAPATPGAPDHTRIGGKADIIPDKVIGDLSGYYVCDGQEGPGKKYKGIAVITKKDDLYVIQWVIGGGVNFLGVGIRNDNMLAAGWSMQVGDKGLLRGVNLYRIEPGPRLIGRWAALPSDGTMRTETLTFLKKIDDE